MKFKVNNVNMEGRWLKSLTPKKLNLKSDLHGTILSHAASLKNAYDTRKVVEFKAFENIFDNLGLESVVRVSQGGYTRQTRTV